MQWEKCMVNRANPFTCKSPLCLPPTLLYCLCPALWNRVMPYFKGLHCKNTLYAGPPMQYIMYTMYTYTEYSCHTAPTTVRANPFTCKCPLCLSHNCFATVAVLLQERAIWLNYLKGLHCKNRKSRKRTRTYLGAWFFIPFQTALPPLRMHLLK